MRFTYFFLQFLHMAGLVLVVAPETPNDAHGGIAEWIGTPWIP